MQTTYSDYLSTRGSNKEIEAQHTWQNDTSAADQNSLAIIALIGIVLLAIASGCACNYCHVRGWCDPPQKKKRNPNKRITVDSNKNVVIQDPEPDEEPSQFKRALTIQVDNYYLTRPNKARNYRLNDQNELSLEDIMTEQEIKQL